MGSSPFAGRFLAFHSALLVTPDGSGVLVCGGQGAGKTSAALWASEIQGAAVATDELAMLDVLTGTFYGIPKPITVREAGREDHRIKIPLGTTCAVHPGPLRVRNVVILEPRTDGLGQIDRVQHAREGFDRVLPHLRSVGADLVSAIPALVNLVETAGVWRLGVCPGPSPLKEDLSRGLQRFFER